MDFIWCMWKIDCRQCDLKPKTVLLIASDMFQYAKQMGGHPFSAHLKPKTVALIQTAIYIIHPLWLNNQIECKVCLFLSQTELNNDINNKYQSHNK